MNGGWDLKVFQMYTTHMMDAFSRLLVYSEIESLGIKGFLNQLLPKVGEQFSDIRFQGGFPFFILHPIY